MVSWVAVTQSLRQEVITDTLTSLAASSAGTRLVLTYVVSPDGLTEMEKAGLAWTMAQAADRGEPFLSLFYPQEVGELLRERGFTSVEHFGPGGTPAGNEAAGGKERLVKKAALGEQPPRSLLVTIEDGDTSN